MDTRRDNIGQPRGKADSRASRSARKHNSAPTVREGVKRIAYAGHVYEQVTDAVWCDAVGGVHENTLTPFNGHGRCHVEDHFPLYTEDPTAPLSCLRRVKDDEDA